jgi:hypothetical protein
MVERAMDLILLFNFIFLIGVVAGFKWWQKKHGKLTEKSFAPIITGYWTIFTLTTFYPLFRINFQVAIIVEIVLLLGFWAIGYPFTRWLYRRFNSSK